MVKQYHITLDSNKLRAYGLTLRQVKQAIKGANQEGGGSAIEMGEAEYMVHTRGYIKNIKDFENIPLGLSNVGTPSLLSNLATIQIGPQMCRGITELNGEGEAVVGIVVMRYEQNALKTIASIKEKLQVLQQSLPKGVQIVETYNYSNLIKRAVNTLSDKLIEEFIVVSLVCMTFLSNFRSSLVIIISLPVGIMMALIVMYF